MKSSIAEKVMKEIGLPFVYYSWPEGGAPKLPYVVYYFPGMETEAADNTVWAGIASLNIELYTSKRSAADEAKVEKALANNDLPFTRSETYLSGEHMVEVLYETEVITDGTD